jgi:hypothetical protein
LAANVANPKIVLTILYDYIIRNNNIFLYKGTLPSLVLNLYKDLRLRKFIRKNKS